MLDTHLLVHGHRQDSPFHDAADACVARCAEGCATWAIHWPCLHGFFSILTHPHIDGPPKPAERALEQIDARLENPSLVRLIEGDRHWPTLRDVLSKARIAGPSVHDARIAALCLQHGVRELCSADRDFGRFGSLRVVNPSTGPRAAVAARRSSAEDLHKAERRGPRRPDGGGHDGDARAVRGDRAAPHRLGATRVAEPPGVDRPHRARATSR